VHQKFETEVTLRIAQRNGYIHTLKLGIYCPGGWNSSVVKATRYGLDGMGRES